MKYLVFIIGLTVYAINSFATDRVVQQNGPGGTYASISAAITAASDGDLIIINNRTDALPWYENLTVNKSLTFVSSVDNAQWWMEGTISITIADNRTVSFVGLKNTSGSGSITCTGTASTNRTVVTIVASDIASDVNISINGVNLIVSSTKARDVTCTYGRITGNDLRSLTLNSDAVVNDDINYVVGNRIGYYATPTGAAFTNSNTSQYLYLSNNFIYHGSNNSALISSVKNGSSQNKILNNTFTCFSTNQITYNHAALYIQISSGTLLVENNLAGGYYSSSTYGCVGIVCGTGSQPYVTFQYNYFNNSFSYGYYPTGSLGNVNSTAAYAPNINSLGLSSQTANVDAGNPSNYYYDLDLSRNDVGCYGGSYSMTNFLPLTGNPESSRVSFVLTPRVVNQGGTVNVSVSGFDK